MQNPYALLGLDRDANEDEIRAAYHARVKRCHPDRVQDASEQVKAQDALVQLNLAYAEAIRQASFRTTNAVGIHDAKRMARRLLDEGRIDSALRMLNKAPDRDAEWFDLHGRILLRKGEAEAAHACFRSAVRMDPENSSFREMALQAAVQMRKQKTLRGRMSGWARGVVNRML